MTARSRSTAFAASAEAAELYRDVVSLVIHELGGVSSALGLRAEALSTHQPNADRHALQALAEQVRDITRLLRLLQGPRTNELLSPMKEAPVQEWWRQIARLLAAVVPRNTVVEHQLGAAMLTSAAAGVLSMLMMLAVRDLTANGWRGKGGLQVRVSSDEGRAVHAVLSIPLTDWPERGARRAVKRWSRYAERIAGRASAHVEWWIERHDTVVWKCSLGSPQVEENSVRPSAPAITPKG